MAKFEIGRQVVTRGVYDKGMEDPAFLRFVNASFVRFKDGDWGRSLRGRQGFERRCSQRRRQADGRVCRQGARLEDLDYH